MPTPDLVDANAEPDPSPRCGRRSVLAFGVAAVALPLPGWGSAKVVASSLTVGYAETGGDASDWRPAHGLLSGDAAFRTRGVRLGVRGWLGPISPQLVAVNLLSHARLPGIAQDVDLLHWGLRAQPVLSVGGVRNQVVPLGADAALKLTLEVRHSHLDTRRAFPLTLSSGWLPGAAKLRRGSYLLAFDGAAAGLDWGALHVVPDADEALFAFDTAGSFGFSGLMLDIDYAV